MDDDGGSFGRARAVGVISAPSPGLRMRPLAAPGAVAVAPETSAYAWLGLMILIGSTTATAAKIVVPSLPFGLLMVLRFGIAGLCLLPLTWRGLARMVRAQPWRTLAAAALCVPINQTFFLNGTRLAPTTHVALIYAICPLVVLSLATLLRQERPGSGRLFGIITSVAGVAVVGIDSFVRSGAATHAGDPRGDLLLIGAVTSWGAYLTVNKPLLSRHGALTVLSATFLIGSILSLPIAWATYPPDLSLAEVPAAAWKGLAYMALVVSVFGLACQNQALSRLDASQVAAIGNASPLLTVTWGVWFLGEPFSPAIALGAILTLGGVIWVGKSG